MKNRNKVAVFTTLSLFIVIASAIYFAAGISSVYEPIKKYRFDGIVNQLIQNITSFASSNSDVSLNLEDRVGDKNGYAIHYAVELKNNEDNIVYDLKFEEMTKSNPYTEISLVGAHDYKNKLGGYHINDNGVKILVAIFETNFIMKLNKIYNSVIEDNEIKYGAMPCDLQIPNKLQNIPLLLAAS